MEAKSINRGRKEKDLARASLRLLNRKVWKQLLTQKILKLLTARNWKVYLGTLTPCILFSTCCYMSPWLAALQYRMLWYLWSDPFLCHLLLTQPKRVDQVLV